jgi:hypothetical protein
VQRTPALAAGLTDHRWTVAELMTFQSPTAAIPAAQTARTITETALAGAVFMTTLSCGDTIAKITRNNGRICILVDRLVHRMIWKDSRQ